MMVTKRRLAQMSIKPPARNENQSFRQTSRSSSKIVLAGELLSIDGFITEGPGENFPITQQLLAQGKPTIVIAQSSEPQPKAIVRPPSTTQAHVEDGANHLVSVLRRFQDGRIGYARHQPGSLRCVNNC